jgi:hypothetical protein
VVNSVRDGRAKPSVRAAAAPLECRGSAGGTRDQR